MKNRIAYIVLIFILAIPSSAQDSLQTVVAETGDGIFSLLRKNEMSPSEYLKPFIQLNSAYITKDNQLIAGKTYKLPKKADDLKKAQLTRYAIFGKEYEVVDSISNRLSGTVYYLISGHGGPDPGAIAKYGDVVVSEDEYAYDVTLRLARELIANGAEVHIIIQDENDGIRNARALELDTDEKLLNQEEIPLNQVERLEQRTKKVNELYRKNIGKYQRLLVTHVDSRTKGKNIDVFFYHHEKSKNGLNLAKSIHETFQKKYRQFQPNRTYTGTFSERSNLYLVKKTLPAMAYIEIGNIKNKKDQKRIFDPENRQALAKWIFEGIVLDYETTSIKNAK